MANGAQAAEQATYRVLRELGRRSQRPWAAMRDGSVVVLHRFTRATSAGHSSSSISVDPEAMAQLLRDARCLTKNWHPNIARVGHVELSGDTLFITTALLDGVTLEELLELAHARAVHAEESVLSHAILARIFLDVLAGLQAFHGLRDGIDAPLFAFHGELCPANVVVGKDGVARIVNVFRPRPVKLTSSSEALGYAAPEALSADDAQDARIDLWAVGVMLWETLVERRLYDEVEPARVAQRQREEDLERPRARLADVAMRALAYDPALRFRSAEDMAASIRALAGSIASGSTVAQTVMELAGERIRMRRLELDPTVSGRRRAAGAPQATQSGTRPRASVSAPTPPRAWPSIAPALAPPPAPVRHRPSAKLPSLPRATVAEPPQSNADRPPPSLPAPSSDPRFRFTPSQPDLETAYAPRPLPARHPVGVLAGTPPLPSRPPAASSPDDVVAELGAELPGTAQILSSDELVDDDDDSIDTSPIDAAARPPPIAPPTSLPPSTGATSPRPAPVWEPPIWASDLVERAIGALPKALAAPALRVLRDRRRALLVALAATTMILLVAGAALLACRGNPND